MSHFRPVVVSLVVFAVVLAFLAGQGNVARLVTPATDSPASESVKAGNPKAPADGRASTSIAKVEVRLAEGTVKQYGRLELSAEGFFPGESVVVTARPEGDAQPIELGQTQADDHGRIGEFAVDLPEGVTSGARPITVASTASSHQATVILYVRAEKLFAVLNTDTPRPADKLGFVAGGFEPGEEVQVFFQDATGAPLATMPTDQAGNTVWTEVTTPVVQAGEYELIFQGSQGKSRYVQRLTVMPLTPTLELSPWAGPPGSKLELNGRGFLPGEEVQVFVGRRDQPATTLKADQYGNLWGIGPLTVPVDTGGGRLEVRLVGQQTGAQVTQTFAVVGVKPWAELSTYSGMPGTAVRFGGGGFAARERVTVHLGNGSGPVVATAQTDEQGNVVQSGAATVPADTTARTQTTVTFALVGESSHGEASAVFTVIPVLVPGFGGERPGSP